MWDLRNQPPPAAVGQATPTNTGNNDNIYNSNTNTNTNTHTNANTGVVNLIGKHDQPVRCLKVMNAEALGTSNPLCVTGSWDKTVKFWDIRQRNVAGEFKHEERVYAMDVKGSITGIIVIIVIIIINIINVIFINIFCYYSCSHS